MSKLEILNRLLLQGFWIRLTRCEKVLFASYEVVDTSAVKGAWTSIALRPKLYKYQSWWAIQYFVIPGTGWNTPLKYLTKEPHYLRISKKTTHVR